jgi:hypothetical protein
VQVDTGRIHPDFPRYLVNFWLLTHVQLDSLATFYHQRHVGPLTFEYPLRVEWPDGMSLEQKRRRFGRFVGLRGCESPGLPPMRSNDNTPNNDNNNNDSVPDTFRPPGWTTTTSTSTINEYENHLRFLEQLSNWRNDPGRNNMDWSWDDSDDPDKPYCPRVGAGLPSYPYRRRSPYPSRSRSRGRSRRQTTRSPAAVRRTTPSSQTRREEQQRLPIYRAEPDLDVEMTIPSDGPPDYAHPLADGQISPLNPSRRRRRGPEDDEILFRKARWHY